MGAREGVEEVKSILPVGTGQCQGMGGSVALSMRGQEEGAEPPPGDSDMAPTIQQFAVMLGDEW